MAVNLKNLQEIGLTETESKIYFYLLENNEKAQSEIAEAFGVGVNRVSTVLKQMLENGIIGIRRIKKIGYYYTTPYEFLKKYVEKKHKTKIVSLTTDLETQKEHIDEVFKSLQGDYAQNNFVTTLINSEDELENFRKNVILPSRPKLIWILNNFELFKKNIKTQKQHDKDRHQVNIDTRGVYTMNTNKTLDDYNIKQKFDGVFIDCENLPDIKTTISVFNDYVQISDITGTKKNIIALKNTAFADTMRSLLRFIYEETKKKE